MVGKVLAYLVCQHCVSGFHGLQEHLYGSGTFRDMVEHLPTISPAKSSIPVESGGHQSTAVGDVLADYIMM